MIFWTDLLLKWIEADCCLVLRETSKLNEDRHFLIFKQYPDADLLILVSAVGEILSKFIPPCHHNAVQSSFRDETLNYSP